MEIVLNNSPALPMSEITKKMFNNKFKSDVEFRVERKVIYAHSWELTKRSVVFEKEFDKTVNDKKLIVVDTVSYDVFYEFIRYIYTDEFKLVAGSEIDLLNLAITYKIVKLENELINATAVLDRSIDLFEYCVVQNYNLIYNYLFSFIVFRLKSFLKSDLFLHTHELVLEAILKFEHVCDLNEIDLFDGFVRWMNRASEENQISAEQQRVHYDKFIRLIRFPTMSAEQFHKCVAKMPDLFTNEDYATISKQTALGPDCKNGVWISRPRSTYIWPYVSKKVARTNKLQWETKFNVSDEIVLCGLRYGVNYMHKPHVIIFTRQNIETKVENSISFIFEDLHSSFDCLTVNLGDSLRLTTGYEYTIEFCFMVSDPFIQVFHRVANQDVIITGPSNVVQISHTNTHLFEMVFKNVGQ